MKNILLLGSYGRGNIGDDIFLLAALRLFPGAKLFINSADDGLLPKEANARVTTIATTGHTDILKKLKVFARIDHIVYCGGDLWVDLIGDRFPRQSLYKMLLVNLVARICGKKVHYLGCGAGDIAGYSLSIARLSARLANSVAVRDSRTAQLLGLPKVQVLPDLATTLAADMGKDMERTPEKRFVIGIAILYFLPNPKQEFPRLISHLQTLLEGLPKKEYKIVLFPMLVSDQIQNDDLWASKELQNALPGKDVEIFLSRDITEYLQGLQSIDLLIGARLHSNILATLSGTPCLGIAYRPKVAQFFEQSGLGDFYLSLADLDKLQGKFMEMHSKYSQVVQRYREAKVRYIDAKAEYEAHIEKHY